MNPPGKTPNVDQCLPVHLFCSHTRLWGIAKVKQPICADEDMSLQWGQCTQTPALPLILFSLLQPGFVPILPKGLPFSAPAPIPWQ